MHIEKTCEGDIHRYECWNSSSVIAVAIVREDESVHILEINVNREWRGHGIGSWLLKVIKDDFNGKKITVEVFRERESWYEKNGFRRVGEKGHLIVMEFAGF
ncbi:MAG: GNAT family N-acetyltransferase [Candidatus Hadarchaeales archaeon]